jgi:outer membrane protein assembly factor BamB
MGMLKKFIIVAGLSALLLTGCTSQSTKSTNNHLAKTPVSSPTATTVPGTLKWTYQIGDPSIHQQYVAFTNPVVENRLVYVAGPDGTHAINTVDGSQKWASPASLFEGTIVDGIAFLPLNADGGVSDIYALSATDGTQKWKFHEDEWVTHSIYWNAMLFTECALHITAINVSDGTIKWSYPTQGYSNFQIVNGIIYGMFTPYPTNTLHVFAIDAITGNKIWETLLDNVDHPLTSFISRNAMYIGSYGKVLALNVANGTKKWIFMVDPDVKTARGRNLRCTPFVFKGS